MTATVAWSVRLHSLVAADEPAAQRALWGVTDSRRV
jgi:hypothetical protein